MPKADPSSIKSRQIMPKEKDFVTGKKKGLCTLEGSVYCQWVIILQVRTLKFGGRTGICPNFEIM